MKIPKVKIFFLCGFLLLQKARSKKWIAHKDSCHVSSGEATVNKSKRAAINHLSQIQIKLKETGISKKSKKYKYNGQQCIIIHSKLFSTQLCVAHANGSSYSNSIHCSVRSVQFIAKA